eukprot:CAMPEP_0181344482 /NCGR_PEP_ID=MMETSP1101-20121128/32198_1 /TAXON_ID=46948 /ORGANISM="Rhodomonas abbreviata, Strain Caron Lab Isolate" /LENGTH=51 /DNA_ID=CAMNT_0023456291 /DNA_START=247 /DNA_END=399 /DNA_ORIENTATION=+
MSSTTTPGLVLRGSVDEAVASLVPNFDDFLPELLADDDLSDDSTPVPPALK